MSGCLSVKQMPFINEFSFMFLSFVSVCLSVCLSNKGHLLMSFPSFFFLCLSAPGGGGAGYAHIRAVRVCTAGKPRIFRPGPLLKTPLFRPGPLLKTPLFRPGPHRKTPLFKNIHLFVPLFRPGLLQKIRLLKIYVCLLF